jgi:hypothetical protein
MLHTAAHTCTSVSHYNVYSENYLPQARRSLGDTHQVALVTGYLLNGEPPDVIEVLADKSPAPFSLNNFTEWATENLLEENLDFYFEVQVRALPAVYVTVCNEFATIL